VFYNSSVGPGEFDTVMELARGIRRHSLCMTERASSSHVASALSCADILAVLYGSVMNHSPEASTCSGRDRLIFSKGHAAVALYSALALVGYMEPGRLAEFGTPGTALAGHVTAGEIPGIECSTGSLGHGLPLAVGTSLAIRDAGSSARVFCVMSDGECQEGSVWEAALLARQWGLDNLHAVIDANGQQGLGAVDGIVRLESLVDKWQAFGWNVREVDGHDLAALDESLGRTGSEAPNLTIARTVKGRGVSFMEDLLEWHYRSPSDSDLAQALRELEAP
jgi:transketolase